MTTTNPGKQTMTVREIARLLGYDRLPDLGEPRPHYDRERRNNQAHLSLDIQDGKLDDPGFAQGKYASLYTNRRELLDDIAIAKDMAYGFGSTPPVELAEVYGWTSREHQDAELKKQQRQRILASEQAAQDLPWEDPEWYRSIAQRYDLKIRIPDNPDIRIAGPDELPADTSPEMLPIAFAHEGSGQAMHGPIIRVLPQQIRGMTREEVENVLAHEMLHTVMDSGTGSRSGVHGGGGPTQHRGHREHAGGQAYRGRRPAHRF